MIALDVASLKIVKRHGRRHLLVTI